MDGVREERGLQFTEDLRHQQFTLVLLLQRALHRWTLSHVRIPPSIDESVATETVVHVGADFGSGLTSSSRVRRSPSQTATASSRFSTDDFVAIQMRCMPTMPQHVTCLVFVKAGREKAGSVARWFASTCIVSTSSAGTRIRVVCVRFAETSGPDALRASPPYTA